MIISTQKMPLSEKGSCFWVTIMLFYPTIPSRSRRGHCSPDSRSTQPLLLTSNLSENLRILFWACWACLENILSSKVVPFSVVVVVDVVLFMYSDLFLLEDSLFRVLWRWCGGWWWWCGGWWWWVTQLDNHCPWWGGRPVVCWFYCLYLLFVFFACDFILLKILFYILWVNA